MHHLDNSGITIYNHYGNNVAVTDPAGAWKTFTTDAMGNLSQVIEPNPAGGNFVTYYTYSTLNQLLTVSMPRPSIPGGGTVTQTRTFGSSLFHVGRVFRSSLPALAVLDASSRNRASTRLAWMTRVDVEA